MGMFLRTLANKNDRTNHNPKRFVSTLGCSSIYCDQVWPHKMTCLCYVFGQTQMDQNRQYSNTPMFVHFWKGERKEWNRVYMYIYIYTYILYFIISIISSIFIIYYHILWSDYFRQTRVDDTVAFTYAFWISWSDMAEAQGVQTWFSASYV